MTTTVVNVITGAAILLTGSAAVFCALSGQKFLAVVNAGLMLLNIFMLANSIRLRP